MSKLAKVAFSAMNGDGETAQLLFEEYCAEEGIATTEPKSNLENVAKLCVGIVSGELDEAKLNDIALEFGYDLTFPEVPNEVDQVTDNLEISQESSTN